MASAEFRATRFSDTVSSSSWEPPIKSRTAPIAALTDDFDFGLAEDKLTPVIELLRKAINKDSPIRGFLLEKKEIFLCFREQITTRRREQSSASSGPRAGWA